MRKNKQVDARITYLNKLAQRWVVQGRIADAQNAIRHMRLLAMKYTTQLTDEKKTFCLKCNTPLLIGHTAYVRIKQDTRIIHCEVCDEIKRLSV